MSQTEKKTKREKDEEINMRTLKFFVAFFFDKMNWLYLILLAWKFCSYALL